MPEQTVQYRLTAAQLAYRRSDALYRGFVGGVGSGKSFAGAYDLIRRAKPDRLYMACAPTYVMLRDASLRSLLQHARHLNYLRDFKRSEMTAVLGNGAEVLFRTADDPERMRGPNLSGVWLDEASLMPWEAFGIAIGRLREGGEQGWLGATFTPKGRTHWTYRVFAAGGPDSVCFRSRTSDNPFLPSGFRDTIGRQYTDEMTRQELEGEFLEDGAYFLYPDAWLQRAGLLPAATGLAEGIGIDPAEGGDKTALCAVNRRGLLERVSGRTPDTNEIYNLAQRFIRQHGLTDEPERVCIDAGGGGKQLADRLRAAGLNVRTVSFGESVVPRPRRGLTPFAERIEQREQWLVFKNRRAELAWSLRLLLDPAEHPDGFAIPFRLYPELRDQMGPIPLLYEDGRLIMLPKDRPLLDAQGRKRHKTLKELIGHSPDEYDALCLACHGMLTREFTATAGVV